MSSYGFQSFIEGENYLLAHGIPSPTYFLLSTKPAHTLAANATLTSALLGEIAGTGYVRQSASAPTPSNASDAFSTLTWNTGTAIDWPASVYSVIAATTINNSGVAICAWDLQPSLDAPTISSITSATTGGGFTAGTYHYMITAINTFGETTGSNEYSYTIANNATMTLSWTAISGATGYHIYRSGAVGGEFTSPALAAIIASGTTTTYTDTGVAATTGAVPTVNTTAPSRAMNHAGFIEQVSPSLFLSSTCTSSSGSGSGGGGGGGGGGTPPGPTITSINPNSGPIAGGTPVTILGTNFTPTANVSFGSTTAASVTFNSSTSLIAVSPAESAGTVHVVVGTVNGSSVQSAADQFTYTTGGGGGTGAYDQAVLFDGPILYITGTTANQGSGIYAISNVGAAASSTLPNGEAAWFFDNSSSTGKYLRVSDPADGSLSINKTGALTLEFWMQLSNVNQPHNPSGLSGGLNLIGKSYDASGSAPLGCEYEFRYYSENSTDSGNSPYNVSFYAFNANCGYGAGYDDHIQPKTTTDWYYWCGVYVGAGATGSVKLYGGVYGSSQYTGQLLNTTPMTASAGGGTAINPSHTTTPFTIGAIGVGSGAGNESWYYGSLGKIAVYNKALAAGRISAHFTAMTPGGGGPSIPTITNLSPSTDTTAGGAAVVITGTNFGGTQGVAFGGLSAAGFVVNSATQITAGAPPHSAGTVNVQVFTTSGTSASVSGSQFTYTSGGGTTYDTAVHTDAPLLYITSTLANQGTGAYTITNQGGAAASVSMPNGDLAWHFNGSSQYINVVDPANSSLSISHTGNLTLELWYRMPTLNQPGEVDTGYLNLVGKSFDASGSLPLGCEYEYRYYSADTTEDPASNTPTDTAFYAFNIDCGAGAGHNDHLNPKVINTWYYACGVYNTGADTLEIYCGARGGSLFHNSTSFTGIVPGHTTTPFTIGGCGIGGGTDSYWFGDIGKVAVYGTALNSTRINAHFAAM